MDKALKDIPIHVEDTSTSIQASPTPSLVAQNSKLDQRLAVGITELPSEEEKKLQHFTKLRPRRNKNNHSSKVAVSEALQEAEQNSKQLWARQSYTIFLHPLFNHANVETSREGVDLCIFLSANQRHSIS